MSRGRSLGWAGIALAVGLAGVGCGGSAQPTATVAASRAPCVVGVNVGSADTAGAVPSAADLRRACHRPPTASAGLPLVAGADAQVREGRAAVAEAGCSACHQIGSAGNSGPGPDLSEVGGRMPPKAIVHAMTDPVSPMPNYSGLGDAKLATIAAYLSALKIRHR